MILHSPSKQNKGFVALLLVGIVAVAALGLAGYEWYSNHNQKLGAVVTDTQLTDTLGTFRTNTNTNIDNINAELNGVSTTIGTYGNLVTLNSPLASIYGGTGLSAAPSANQFLSASGTMPAWKTITWGSGLNSTTTATSVQISTQGIDTTANYNWTGLHTFTSLTSASTTLSGTTTVNGTLIIPTSTALGKLVETIFTASGTYIVPTGVTSIDYYVLGGAGNGGAGYEPGSGSYCGGGGGGSGGTYYATSTTVTPLQIMSVVVGLQGATSAFNGHSASGGGNGGNATAGCTGGSAGVGGSPNGNNGGAGGGSGVGGSGGSPQYIGAGGAGGSYSTVNNGTFGGGGSGASCMMNNCTGSGTGGNGLVLIFAHY